MRGNPVAPLLLPSYAGVKINEGELRYDGKGRETKTLGMYMARPISTKTIAKIHTCLGLSFSGHNIPAGAEALVYSRL